MYDICNCSCMELGLICLIALCFDSRAVRLVETEFSASRLINIAVSASGLLRLLVSFMSAHTLKRRQTFTEGEISQERLLMRLTQKQSSKNAKQPPFLTQHVGSVMGINAGQRENCLDMIASEDAPRPLT